MLALTVLCCLLIGLAVLAVDVFAIASVYVMCSDVGRWRYVRHVFRNTKSHQSEVDRYARAAIVSVILGVVLVILAGFSTAGYVQLIRLSF